MYYKKYNHNMRVTRFFALFVALCLFFVFVLFLMLQAAASCVFCFLFLVKRTFISVQFASAQTFTHKHRF